MTNSNANVENIINQFLEKSVMFSRILDKEAEYFEAGQFDQVEKLSDNKSKILSELETLKYQIDANSEAIKALPEDIKKGLKEVNERMLSSSKNNLIKASVARETNKVVIDAINHAVNKNKQEFSSYAKFGEGNDKSKNDSGPIAINQSV